MDILIVRLKDKFDTAVFRKPTNTNIYLHWNAFAPKVWMKGTLKSLVSRAFKVCSTDYFLKMELDHIQSVFHNINEYPKWLIKDTIENERKKFEQQQNTPLDVAVPDDTPNQPENIPEAKDAEKEVQMFIPYQGKMGESIIRRMRNRFKHSFPNTKISITYKSTKLSSKFSTKDKIKKDHNHDIVYLAKCPDCSETYIGETARRLSRRVEEHAGKDKNSHVTKHSQLNGHKPVSLENFEIIGSNFKNNEYCRKIAESILIKRLKPSLNIQDMSIPIELFN